MAVIRNRKLFWRLSLVAALAYSTTAWSFGEDEVVDGLTRDGQYDHRSVIQANAESREITREPLIIATVIESRSATAEAKAGEKSESAQVMSLLEQKEFDKALERAAKMIKAQPKDPAGYNLQARCLRRQE